jgi:hypothetical protein
MTPITHVDSARLLLRPWRHADLPPLPRISPRQWTSAGVWRDSTCCTGSVARSGRIRYVGKAASLFVSWCFTVAVGAF